MFLSKEQMEATIEAYDIDVTGLNWPQKQGAVSKYLAEHGLEVVGPKADAPAAKDVFPVIEEQTAIDNFLGGDTDGDMPELTAQQLQARAIAGDLSAPAASAIDLHMHIPIPGEPVIIKGKAKRVQLEAVEKATDPWLAMGLINKRVMFSPEIITNHYQTLRYREDLGPAAIAEDKNYTGEDLDARNIQGAPGTSNGLSGTYTVTEIEGERSEAISTLPKYGSAIYWDFGPEGKPVTYFPIVEFNGQRGYLYKHSTIPSVYGTLFADPMLREHGYYHRFKEQLSDEPNVMYLAGILAVNMDFTHYMMQEIQREEQKRND